MIDTMLALCATVSFFTSWYQSASAKKKLNDRKDRCQEACERSDKCADLSDIVYPLMRSIALMLFLIYLKLL